MIVVHRYALGEAPPNRQVVLLFGVGLVGGSILRALVNAGFSGPTYLPFTWGAKSERAEERNRIADRVLSLANFDGESKGRGICSLQVVWCAGKGGFGSTHTDLVPELEAFGEVLGLSGWLYQHLAASENVFHLVSSAGGLFEGQRQVDAGNQPKPLRAYGDAKMRQEEEVSVLTRSVVTRVYRPTSVYGFTSGGRAGLIAALIQNAISNGTTRIYGDPDTIRDYVLADDVGRFIGMRVSEVCDCSHIEILGSGKPTSMMEVIRLVEAKVNRKLYLQFDTSRTNRRDFSVRSSRLPWGWRATELGVGVSLTVRRIQRAFQHSIDRSRVE